MATVDARDEVGALLREWRTRRRMTQLDLALEAGTSARHLSFVETGRSRPGRDLLLRVLEHLDVPFRERNRLLLAAGHAPAFPERALDDPELAPVRAALDAILARHEPYPGIVVDRAWNVVAANAPARAFAEQMDVEPALLEPPVNAMRVGLHPRGLAPMVVNLGDWHSYFRERLARQVALTGDPEIAALLDEVASYPGVEAARDPAFGPAEGGILGPLRLRGPGGAEHAFFGMFATFDTPFEVTTSELAAELLFPADRETAAALERAGGDVRADGQAGARESLASSTRTTS